ncbi:MAG: type II toxin-antitoxin system RelE/ParE family toxin [Candidatus Dadabacteria bacterium]|nr:type II toxin-antitoxin system RelE/ParE family toxin [Candidatus Dadabacteria bacterium]NIX14996.1 type II toxin-antitoxin system RelE/ParE family toxin [Candidatus Dadabacteria bacterium]
MPKAIKGYELSLPAEQDLSSIYDYTFNEFGELQAVKYLTGIEQKVLNIVESPELGIKREEIRQGLRSIVYEKHVIFYRVMNDTIRIIRVLHGSRDLPKFLK